MGERRARRIAAPKGLKVEMIDDEFAVFSWDGTDRTSESLTDAERDVLRHVASGASNAQIAKLRRSSVHTVANQVSSLLRKLGAASRYDLMRR
jgi:two-component system response regulator DesR